MGKQGRETASKFQQLKKICANFLLFHSLIRILIAELYSDAGGRNRGGKTTEGGRAVEEWKGYTSYPGDLCRVDGE